jgi:hypothetical protein
MRLGRKVLIAGIKQSNVIFSKSAMKNGITPRYKVPRGNLIIPARQTG